MRKQGSLTSLLGDLQAAEARLSGYVPQIFTRAWADHEAMLAALDDLTAADDVAPGLPRTPPWPNPPAPHPTVHPTITESASRSAPPRGRAPAGNEVAEGALAPIYRGR